VFLNKSVEGMIHSKTVSCSHLPV